MDTTPFLIVCLANLSAGCALHRASDKFQDNPRYSAYAGEYQMGTNVGMIVRLDRDRLMAKVSGQDYFQMFPSGRDSFFFKVVDAQVTFARSEGLALGGRQPVLVPTVTTETAAPQMKTETYGRSRMAGSPTPRTQTPESNRRLIFPLDARQEFRRAVQAQTCTLGGGRSANR